jgi:hypothetical protein
MGSHRVRKQRKPTLSLHQKQVRFFIGLAIVLITLLTAFIVWLSSWMSLPSR